MAALSKLAWKIIAEPTNWWVRLVKQKCLRRDHFFTAKKKAHHIILLHGIIVIQLVNLCFAVSKNLGHIDIHVAEAMVLREGLLRLSHVSSQAIIVEGDFKLLIDALNQKTSTLWRIKFVLQDIMELTRLFASVMFGVRPIFRLTAWLI
ncbi:hypothetical protein RchiOBHm_Chr6g0289481 [Rosa chinensis]|uniref:RNase H type-1 domain-containing protein n=1 Tax=Rosa chinensis TaxID=74649 RepID=A0A2P6PVL9_ROSCH|nr:hypothetical protein RchiOBHm_Chr6g0289481 [Rosa chinensis]